MEECQRIPKIHPLIVTVHLLCMLCSRWCSTCQCCCQGATVQSGLYNTGMWLNDDITTGYVLNTIEVQQKQHNLF